jgi:hypothetical protein
MPANKKLFLSAVSSEFEGCRRLLSGDLRRPTLDLAVQEDFGVGGGLTLDKLDDYIRACNGVVHLVGKATGAAPQAFAARQFIEQRLPDLAERLPSLAPALKQPDPGFSYTQWEAYLAIYHRRELFIYRPTDFESAVCACPREARFIHDAAEEVSQREHYRRLCALGRDRGLFADPERLSSAVLRDLVEILPRLETRLDVPPTRLRHTAAQLVGREAELSLLDHAWNDSRTKLLVIRGKGGEGKTALVATWMAELAAKDWRGAERVLDWSFYSQGTREQVAATAEVFIQQALAELGDPDPNAGDATARAARLAKLIGGQRCLLVLDGLEPLQHPPGPMRGALKDPGMAALLRGLVARNEGLCVITTREQVLEIEQHYGKSAVDHELKFLTPLAGAQLLYQSGARRAGNKDIHADDPELQRASEEVRGHALTLALIGQYLRLTAGGDIRQRDRMKLSDADSEYKNDATRPYGHAFKAMEAYERWYADGDEGAHRQLAVLRMLGLFDRPAPADCLAALRDGMPISGLTDAWSGAKARDWSIALERLQEIGLVSETDDRALDCHPLVREYFATRLKQNDIEAFRTGHSRLFDHLCSSTEHRPDTLVGLQPLYQAVIHGCLAGRQQETLDEVYWKRIQRGNQAFSHKDLGAFGADLGAVAAFFDEPWRRVSGNLTASTQAWILHDAAVCLDSLGRPAEALEPMRASVEMDESVQDWEGAAASCNYLSALEVRLGLLGTAVADSRRGIGFADRRENSFENSFRRVTLRAAAADALHQVGEYAEAGALFRQSELMGVERQPKYSVLYSMSGFLYADFLLAAAERGAWRKLQQLACSDQSPEDRRVALGACAEGERRCAMWVQWRAPNDPLLDVALEHLTQARAQLYRTIMVGFEPTETGIREADIELALTRLRDANTFSYLPLGLLSAAFYYAGVGREPQKGEQLLDEAQHIAERGPMPLYLADVHLHRARLFRDRTELQKARTLIEKHGYWRRREELADAEEASAGWP